VPIGESVRFSDTMRMIRVVLDTNVVVSAHLNDQGFERHILDLALADRIEIVASDKILIEYEDVLRRPKFAISSRQVAKSLRLIRSRARIVNPQCDVAAAQDPDDNCFLECAEAGRADYLVTGNRRHFPKKWRQTLVVNARELIEWITPDLQR
jgi:putative PIN family toxin of toxin-antitoxin system